MWESDPMMQVFMPYSNVEVNIQLLDELTLNSQCSVSTAILEGLGKSEFMGRWNPAIKMWVGNEAFLGFYAHRLIGEWKANGFKDHWSYRVRTAGYIKTPAVPVFPWWWGHKDFHRWNRLCLYRENPDWYGRFFPDEDLDPKQIGWWPSDTPHKFIRGPKMLRGPYLIGESPVFERTRMMPDADFIQHANLFHELTPDINGGIRSNERPDVLNTLRALHDRFHTQRVYISHDHR